MQNGDSIPLSLSLSLSLSISLPDNDTCSHALTHTHMHTHTHTQQTRVFIQTEVTQSDIFYGNKASSAPRIKQIQNLSFPFRVLGGPNSPNWLILNSRFAVQRNWCISIQSYLEEFQLRVILVYIVKYFNLHWTIGNISIRYPWNIQTVTATRSLSGLHCAGASRSNSLDWPE